METAVIPTRRRKSISGFLFTLWKKRISYAMLMPFLAVFTVFGLYPIAWSARLSLTEYRGIKDKPPQYVGIDNFKNILSLSFKELPPELDEATGEQIFRCDGEKVIESVAREMEATGVSCEARMVRPRDVLPEGHSEYDRFSFRGTTYIIGATDPRFWKALYNTTLYTMGSVFFSTFGGLALALFLQKQTRVNMTLRVVFFLPAVTSGIAITAVWRWIFTSQNFGLVNTVFRFFGWEQVTFLANVDWTMRILIWLALWGGMGFPMILFLAGLKNVPQELYEAAAIDGASVPQRFRHITIPLLRPTFLYVVVMGIIGAFQVFDVVYIVFSTTETIGGVLDSALTVVTYLYDTGFNMFELGYAASVAWILFAVIFVMTMISLRLGRVNELY
ncbi:MAG: sugar ABC transporter permease [Chloroflexi bacterium]|nr:sugar ABC transporter permease [Chloroflexota bacterium]